MLTVVVPSRGRPENVKRLQGAFMGKNAIMVLAVAVTDPMRMQYEAIPTNHIRWWLTHKLPDGCVAPMNDAATRSQYGHEAIGFMGDDHLPQGPDWVQRVEDELAELWKTKGAGIVYGDDGLMGENLPTAVFMTHNIVQTLGWMAPPVLRHLYCDNFWKDLGEHLGILKYLPDVKITHLHPHADVGIPWDATYEVGNAPNIDRDHDYYQLYKKYDFPEDVAKLKKMLR